MILSKPFERFHLEKTTHFFNIINLHIMLLCSNSHFIFLKFKIKFFTKWMPWHCIKMMMNCFCSMVDWRKVFSLNSSQGHCQRSSSSWISDMLQPVFESVQNLSSGFVECSCAIVMTTTPRCHFCTFLYIMYIFALLHIMHVFKFILDRQHLAA